MSKETIDFPADFWDKKNAVLEYMEEGIRRTEDNYLTAEAILAISYGRIRREKMYLECASSFKAYLKLKRTYSTYKNAIRLSIIGMNWWEHRTDMADNGVILSDHMSKIGLLHMASFEPSTIFWYNFKQFTYEGLAQYLRNIRDGIDMYPDADNGKNIQVAGASIMLNGVKLKGLNLNEAKREIAAGRRAVVIWANDDNHARRIRRKVAE